MEYKFFASSCLKDTRFKVTIGRYLRYYIRKIIFYSYVKKFENFVNTQPFFIDFFQKHPVAAYVVIKNFCNKRFGAKQRYEHVISDLTHMQKLHSQSDICLWEQRVELWRLDEDDVSYRLFLEKNPETSEEGFWALVLRDEKESRIYHASFTFPPNGDFLIASVQGSKGGGGTLKR